MSGTTKRIITPRDTNAVQGDGGANQRFAIGLARAFGGAVLFGLPLLMTMEMWWLSFQMDATRLALLLAVLFPLLVGLSYVSGFEETASVREDLRDASVAVAVGAVSSLGVLSMFGLFDRSMGYDEIIGRVALLTVPASIGALLAQSQLSGGEDDEERERKRQGYWHELLLMIAGALFLAIHVAPTEEIQRIAYMLPEWNAPAIVVVSVVVMHAFVYSLEFRGQHTPPRGVATWQIFLRHTVAGYSVALLVSAYVLWTFGRFTGDGMPEIVIASIVLGFPAAVGAAAARLIL